MKKVEIYTDGACSGNPGPGGYAAVLRCMSVEKTVCAGYKLTTNNRMEVMAAAAALETLKQPCLVTLYSDSRYLVDSVTKGWLSAWESKNWQKTKTSPVLNADLWQRLCPLLAYHAVAFVWVRGHARNELNNRCDELARQIIKNGELKEDLGYVKQAACPLDVR